MCGMHDDPSMIDEPKPESFIDPVGRLCKHVQYNDAHCVHEACWNYYSKCPRHAGIFPEMKEICTQEDRI